MVDVDTWEVFLTELQKRNNEINITADLDANDGPLMTGINVGNVTIHGNDHTIFNISTAQIIGESMFTVDTDDFCNIDKLNFYNIFNNEKRSIFSSYYVTSFNSTPMRGWHFTDCNFQGRGYSLFDGAACLRCAINWDCGMNGVLNSGSSSSYKLVLDYCYVNVKIAYNAAASSTNTVISSYHETTNSYIGGSINITDGTKRVRLLSDGIQNNKFGNNAFNITTCNIPDNLYVINDTATIPDDSISIYNSTFFKGPASPSPYLVACTDDEMHNAQALYDKGFDIIVS